MLVDAIDDEVSSTVDTTESYIRDLETEVAQLQSANKLLKKQLKHKPQDINCCEAYKKIVKSFHNLLDDILPF